MLRRSLLFLLVAVLTASLAAASRADPETTVSIGDVTVIEGNIATFNVALNAASSEPVTVDYATLDDSATSPADYDAVPTTAPPPPPAAPQTVTKPKTRTKAEIRKARAAGAALERLLAVEAHYRTEQVASFVDGHRLDIAVAGVATLLVAAVVALPSVTG